MLCQGHGFVKISADTRHLAGGKKVDKSWCPDTVRTDANFVY